MKSNTVLRNIVIFTLFLIPLFPLIVTNSLYFPFITGKALAFRIIVEVAFALWLVLAYKDRSYAPRWNGMTILVTAFTLAALVADLLGVNWIRSLWSNFERMEGWLMIVHLWGYFIVLTSVFRDKAWWTRYFHMTIAVAGIISLYGIAQLLGSWFPWFAAHFPIHQGSSRLDATLGNSAYLAVYMIFHAFLVAYLAALAWADRKIDRMLIYSAVAALFTFVLFETQTRGTELGVVGGVFLALVLYAVWPKGAAEARTSFGRSVAGSLALVLVLLSVGFYFARNVPLIKNSAMFGRLASISLSDTTTVSRLKYIWPMAVTGSFSSVKTSIIGLGQENFNYIFNADYSPHMYADEQWFDRAHDVFLDWLVAGGLVGFLLYISFYLFSLWYVWKSALSVAEKSILTGLLAGYAVHNIFVFDNLSSYYLFFLFLAFVSSLRPSRGSAWLENRKPDSEIANYVIAPVVAILFVALIYMVNVRPLLANHRLIAAIGACQNQPNPSLWQKALKVDVYEANQEIREQFLSCASGVIQSQDADPMLKQQFFALAQEQIAAQVAATPGDARVYVLAGSFYNSLGQWALGQPLLEKAHQLTPGKQQADFQLGINYLNSGKDAQGVALFKEAYEADTSYSDAAIDYASALIATGDEKDADAILDGHDDWKTDNRIVNAYVSIKDYSKVLQLYKGLVAKNPSNIQYRVSLAAAYYTAKDSYDAVVTLRQAIKDFPLYESQLQTLISQIQSGTVAVQGAQ